MIRTIEAILSQCGEDIQLVVQDNSESVQVKDHVAGRPMDPRLVYFYEPRTISAMENFNEALGRATGTYVCFIGDDDGVHPGIAMAARWCLEQGIDALTPTVMPSFTWPGAGVPATRFTPQTDGTLMVPDYRPRLYKLEPGANVLRLLRNGGVYYLDYRLAKLYHGIVRRSALQDLKARTGVYLGALSPDIYSSIQLSTVLESVAFIDFPLTVPGVCGASTSVASTTGRHTGKLSSAPHLRARGNYDWDWRIPEVYSPETIWAESAVAALRAIGRSELVDELNVDRLIVSTWDRNPAIRPELSGQRKRIFQRLGRAPAGRVAMALYWLTGPAMRKLRRINNRFLLILGVRTLYRKGGVSEIGEAMRDVAARSCSDHRTLRALLDGAGVSRP